MRLFNEEYGWEGGGVAITSLFLHPRQLDLQMFNGLDSSFALLKMMIMRCLDIEWM